MAKMKGKRKKAIATKAPSMTNIKKDAPNHMKMVWDALHFAQYDMTDKALKTAALEYAKSLGAKYKVLSVLPEKELTLPGKYAHIILNGGELPDSMVSSLERLYANMLARAKTIQAEKKEEASEKKAVGPVITVQYRMREQAATVAAVIDGWLDDLALGNIKKIDEKEMNPSEQMQVSDFKAGQARHLKSFYESELAEWQAVVAGKDEELKEGYSNIKKANAKRVVELLEKVLESATMFEKVSKAQRKTRKAKPKSVTKQVEKLKYMAKSDELGVVSENPINVVGAQEVWTYNTKYRKLGRYVASDSTGLSVKGTTFRNFATSSVQKTLRKPKEQIKEFMGAGKVKLRKFMDEIKAVDTKLNGRMNAHILILKVIK